MASKGGSWKSGKFALAVKSSSEVKGGRQPKLPDGVTAEKIGGFQTYEFKSGDNKVSLNILPDFFDPDSHSVSFSVNGSSTAGALKGREADLAALKIRRIITHDASTRPDGFKYECNAVIGDSRGATRAVAYESAGFSRPVAGRAGGTQYAIVRNGKLTPDNATLRQYETNTPAGQVAEGNYRQLRRQRDRERAINR
ncbi:hypothetical protein IQ268_08980 [Oculatella sp. LEGE 06141]|uniref:hypothetical protein n=1 Tax=Oculatella sp. LEGE 06141 TaxID=1828648 RepID=UPI00187E931A|nr:hypothetical protein [Oculatella sp. LEGE 06141]MBE9178692.1 hypothetical protein [Oculatella sp. LEGE 06141]